MLSDRILQEMIAFNPGAPVLSVYLDVDPLSGAAETARLRLRQMVKPFESRAEQDVERVLRYIDHEYDGSGRSLALFSGAEVGFFHEFINGVVIIGNVFIYFFLYFVYNIMQCN